MLPCIKNSAPVVHCITNHVTANDCANILIACGAKPVMADCSLEAFQITKRCNALVLNTGTLSVDKAKAMLLSANQANKNNIPIVLDPVGAGSSEFRKSTIQQLLNSAQITIIKGNASEIKAICNNTCSTAGVDVQADDVMQNENVLQNVNLAKLAAQKYGCIVVITGKKDIVADKSKACIIKNGHPLMAAITGSGCMLSAIIAAFAASEKNVFNAAVKATLSMGICGQLAAKRMKEKDGNASYRTYLIDAMYNLTQDIIKEHANYEML